MSIEKKIEADSASLGSVQLKKIGNSTGFIIPKEMMGRLGLSPGDTFHLSLSAEGGIRFTPYDPKFEKAMEVARRGMKVYKNALAELAK
jgi:putative addiction module antidote